MAKARNPAKEDLALIDAFKHVFKEHGKDAQVNAVLAELASFSGYYSVAPEDATALQYARREGRREVFARILYLVGVSSEYREVLRQAATQLDELLGEEGTR